MSVERISYATESGNRDQVDDTQPSQGRNTQLISVISNAWQIYNLYDIHTYTYSLQDHT
jgi:hypothetical protein